MTDDALVARLRTAGCVFAEEEAAALRGAASTGTAPTSAASTDAASRAATHSTEELEQLVARRIAGEPLEVVIGYAEFAGLRIPVAPGVFVPRTRTQLVARLAVDLAPPSAIMVDLCCGSGAIAAAVAHARPDLTVWAADIDPTAINLAAKTLARFGARALVSDMDKALPVSLRGHVAVIASCPPYVPTAQIALMPPEARDHEPHAALDGGVSGADLQARVFQAALRLLAPDGVCIVETSNHLSDVTLTAARAAGLTCRVVRDKNIDAVAVVARR